MARLSKKERARRLAIGRGVRRYWRKVKQQARREAKPIRQVRRELQLAKKALPVITEEFAFNLKSRVEAKDIPNPFARFRGRDTITVQVRSEFRATPDSAPQIDSRIIAFDVGATDEETWSNYFEAIRDYYDDELEAEDADAGQYERFAIFVGRMA